MNNSKNIVIIGAGSAGVTLANKLSKTKGTNAVLVDPSLDHYYQPGYLFVPFGMIKANKLKKPLNKLVKKHVNLIQRHAKHINTTDNTLVLDDDSAISYDVLVIASGTHIDPNLTEGMVQGWHKNIFDFYTPEGSELLRKALESTKSGKVVIQITEMPIKCPVAPLEFAFLADDYFTKKGVRKDVIIEFVTPLSGAFTKPVASAKLGSLLVDKNINVTTDFYVEKVDSNLNKLHCYDGRIVDYDLLVTIPTNVGARFLHDTELVDDLGFVLVDKNSLQSTKFPNIFAIGDATNVPTSKAGSVAHFETDVVHNNIIDYLNGRPLSGNFDGHSNCFVEIGGGKALLLDFNYDTEPLEGLFPFAYIGPMKLLKPSRINHWGKLAFRYIYWYMLIPGHKIPFITDKMSMRGKKVVTN